VNGDVCHGIDDGEGERGSKGSSCEGECVVVMIMEEWDGVEQKV